MAVDRAVTGAFEPQARFCRPWTWETRHCAARTVERSRAFTCAIGCGHQRIIMFQSPSAQSHCGAVIDRNEGIIAVLQLCCPVRMRVLQCDKRFTAASGSAFEARAIGNMLGVQISFKRSGSSCLREDCGVSSQCRRSGLIIRVLPWTSCSSVSRCSYFRKLRARSRAASAHTFATSGFLARSAASIANSGAGARPSTRAARRAISAFICVRPVR